MKLKKGKLSKFRKQIITRYLTVFWSTFLFVFVVAFLRKYGYIKDFSLENIIPEQKMREDTDVGIVSLDIKNKALIVRDKKLYVRSDGVEQELISEAIVSYPGILEDGRIYFFKQGKNGYGEIYLQKGGIFEKVKIPTEKNDSVPKVAPDGNYVVFLSKRDSVGNFLKNDMYIYDLNSFKLAKINTNDFMNMEEFVIAPNSGIVAFSYNYVKPGSKNSTPSLGLLMDRTTSNLYEEVKVKDEIYFNKDSKNLFFQSENGLSLFSLEKGKVVDELQEAVLVNSDRERTLAKIIKTESDSKEASASAKESDQNKICDTKDFSYVFFEMKNGKLNKVGEVMSEYVIRDVTNFDTETNEMVGIYVETENCNDVFGVLNWESDTIVEISPTKEGIFFAL